MNAKTSVNNSLKTKNRIFGKYLWVSCGLTILIPGALLLISLFYARSQLRRAAYAQTYTLSLALDEINRRQLEAMAMPLDYVTRKVQGRGGLDKISQREFDNLFTDAISFADRSNVRSIFALDVDGHVRLSAGFPTIESAQKQDSEFDYLKTQKNFTITTTAISPKDGRQLLVLNKILRTKEGRFSGVIGVTRSIEDFESFYKTLELPMGVSFAIFRDDGEVIYRFPRGGLLASSHFAFPENIRMDSEGVIEGSSNVDGDEKIGYYKFLAPYGAMTYVGYNRRAIYTGWRVISAMEIAIFSLFTMILIYLVNLLKRRQESLRKNLEDHYNREELIRLIQQKTEVLTGQDFLRELGLQISTAFAVRNVTIGVLLPEHLNSVKFVVNIVDGQFGTNYIYDLKNTPFGNLKPGEFFVYPKSVSKIFTQDPLLSYRNVEFCMGLVLQDSEQQANGIMMIYSEEEMVDLDLKRTVLSVFAARAGVELERIRTDGIRKEVEKLRKQIEERSLQSEKMEAIGSLAQGIAHDFNNILAIIMATTEKMTSEHKDSAQDQHYLEIIRSAGNRARQLVTQILAFGRRDDSSVEPIQIKKICTEMSDFLHSTLPAQIRLSLDFSDCAELTINANHDQIQLAFLNLCVNAARAVGSTNGGEIRVSLRRAQIKDRPYVNWSLNYKGEELDRDKIEKIFDPVYAQNISMVAAQRIINNHQGFIEVKSVNGQGTFFDIFLPVANSTHSEEVKMKPFSFRSDKKVMIIDDEPEIGTLIKELLVVEGLHVDAFVDPLEAMRVFSESQSNYFVIISDLSMPGMSGAEFMRKIRDINKKIPLILWSGYHHFLGEELQDLNVKILSKPIAIEKLLDLISLELSQMMSPDISPGDRGPDNEPEGPT